VVADIGRRVTVAYWRDMPLAEATATSQAIQSLLMAGSVLMVS
jgi:hypothetical protein